MKMITLQAIALFLGFSLSPTTAQEGQLTYQLDETWIEGGGGATTLHVTQSGGKSVGRHEPDGDVALVSNPAGGIISARPARSLPFLIEVMDVPGDLGPGSLMPSAYGGLDEVVALRFDIQRGDADRTLEGHAAEHHVLTIDLEWQLIAEDGSRSTNRSHGKADLWTASDLPFSWLPYTCPPGFAMGAVPLSFQHSQVAAHVLTKLADELNELGLLLRAEVKSSIVMSPESNAIGQETVRELSLKGLEQTSGSLDAPELDQAVLTPARYMTLMLGLRLAGGVARQEAPAGAGELRWKTDEAQQITGEGTARVCPAADDEGDALLVLGAIGEESNCVIVLTDPEVTDAGEYRFAPGYGSGAWDALAGPKAQALSMRGTRESLRVTVIEDGSLVLSRDGEGRLVAELHGTGWTVVMAAASPSLIEDVNFELSFLIEAAAQAGTAEIR